MCQVRFSGVLAAWGPICGFFFIESYLGYQGVRGRSPCQGHVFIFSPRLFLIFLQSKQFQITFVPLFYTYFSSNFIIGNEI